MTINGITIKTPSHFKVSMFRITSNAERTASGKMKMDIIAIKRRLDLRYELISETELKKILDALESRTFHTVVYPDPQRGENAQIVAYAGDINTDAWQKVGNRYWRNVPIALIEQ